MGKEGVLEQQPTNETTIFDKFKDENLQSLNELEQAEDEKDNDTNPTFGESNDIPGSTIHNID